MVDKSNEGQVDDGRMNCHIIQKIPKNSNIPKIGNQFNTEWNEMKLKIGDNLQFQQSTFWNYA